MTYYDDISGGYDELHADEQDAKRVIVKDLLAKHLIDIRSDTTLLDVGCGTGVSSQFDCDVTGIDPSEGLLKIYERRNPSMKTVVGVAEELPFPDDSFDIVVSLTAVQNFKDIAKGILEIARVAKKYVVISVLKKSLKISEISACIRDIFDVIEEVEEDKDIIFLCVIKYINQDAN